MSIIAVNIHIYINKHKMLTTLISDVTIYNSIPLDVRHIIIEQKKDCYSQYVGILDLFEKLTEKSIVELATAIKNKLDDNYTYNDIVNEYGNNEYTCLIRYILHSSNKYDECKCGECHECDTDSNSDNEDINTKFTWNSNQVAGWTNAVNCNFASGIHSQATGAGKSLMALKIIWEYHKQYPNNNIMWLCERKDIPQKLFFTKDVNGRAIYNKRNFDFWRDNDIIYMDAFHICEYVYCKNNTNWVSTLNNIKSTAPIFIIINRAYLTAKSCDTQSKYKYEELRNNIPNFVILDECHSSMANGTYKLLMFIKWNWKANIQGLSATPYRKGKSYTTIDIDINCPDLSKIKTQENENKLINIFHKQGNVNEINILSWFNLKEAIENNIILEPIFHWFYIDEYKYDGITPEKEIDKILSVLNNIVNKCKYKKCIVWCRLISIANMWNTIFNKYKHEHANLRNMISYVDHTKSSGDYDEFYGKYDNAILFCASKFREGSDIPYLSCCMFLDKVKDRSDLPFIQCIGRVLRKDIQKLKEYGHIIDGCVAQEDESKMKSIINKLLRYYLQLYEISKSDIDFASLPYNKYDSKLIIYDNIMQSLRLVPDENKIYIDLKNNKKITLNLNNVDIKTMEWNNIIPKFDALLKHTLILCDYEEFVVLKKRVVQLNIKNMYDYDDKWKDYKLYSIDERDGIVKIEPKIRFPSYFDNWYAFLDIDTSIFIKDKETWALKCELLGVTKNNYLEKIKDHPDMPDMPEEFYKDFTNMLNELKCVNINKRNVLFM
jgi:hypothetical protein